MYKLDSKDIPKIMAIYRIKNTSNNKSYIGSAVDLRVRIHRHFYELEKQVHVNQHLLRSFNKYGKDCFIVEIVESFDKINLNDLLKLEESYIEKEDLLNCGYNKKISNSEIIARVNKSENHIARNKQLQSKKIMAFNRITGEFVKEYDSISDAAREINSSSTNISGCCRGRFRYVKDYVFCYKEDYDPFKQYIAPNHWALNIKKEESHRLKLKKSMQDIFGQDVYQYDEDLNLINKYNSRLEAERANNLKKESLRYKIDRLTLFNGYYWTSKELN